MVMAQQLPLKQGTKRGGGVIISVPASCDVHLCLTDDITHCYHQEVKYLAEKLNLGGSTLSKEELYHLKN